MSMDELDDLAALWREEPDGPERAEIERFACKVRRQGRLLACADIGLTVLLIGGAALAALATPSPLLLAGALLLAAATLWLTWQRRVNREIASGLDAGDGTSFVAARIRLTRGNLRRNALTLASFPVFVPAVVLFKATWRTGGDPHAAAAVVLAWAGSARGLVTVAVLALLMAYFLRARRHHRTELRRLEDLRRSYEEEGRRDAEAAR